VTVALDRLEKAGYIQRRPNPADRRSLMIALVPSALTKLGKYFEGANAGALWITSRHVRRNEGCPLCAKSAVRRGAKRKTTGAVASPKSDQVFWFFATTSLGSGLLLAGFWTCVSGSRP
jgi:hypothetical protein